MPGAAAQDIGERERANSATSVYISPLPDPSDATDLMKSTPDLIAPAAPDTYRVGADDLLSVFVYQMPELTRQVRVSNRGTIALPFLQKDLVVESETAPQIAEQVSAELVRQGLARQPYVQVTVRQVMSKSIVISGAVRYPMVIQASRPMSLLEVISRAGGLMNAGTTAVVSRDVQGSVQEYSLDRLIQNTDPRNNPMLRGGESVRVLPARMVYAVGALERPGAFPIQTGEPISALKALALSGGVKSPADKSHSFVFRSRPDGSRQEIPVNLDKLLKHKVPDLPLMAGDILYVPESGRGHILNTAGASALAAVTIAIGYGAANGKL